MADIDFKTPNVEKENVGKTTENPTSNAQNEVNESRAAGPSNGRAETASQTEALTKGPNPVLPAFDMSDFGPGAGTSSTNATGDMNFGKRPPHAMPTTPRSAP